MAVRDALAARVRGTRSSGKTSAAPARGSAITVEAPKIIPPGWLLRLRFRNHGAPSRFTARVHVPPHFDIDPDVGALPLTWRGRDPSLIVELGREEEQLIRLAIARTASAHPRLVFATNGAEPVKYVINPDRPFVARVEVCDANAISVAEAGLTITFRPHDFVPQVTFGPVVDGEPETARPVPARTASVPDGRMAPATNERIDRPGLAEVLQCVTCGGTYAVGAGALTCETCGASFPVVDGVAVLLDDDTTGTTLEHLDYDAIHGIDETFIARTGEQWDEVIARLGLRGGAALEIGAGTGALTLGLLQQGSVASLTATDVSQRFLAELRHRITDPDVPVEFVACDANRPHFRPDAFDLVLGRSVLHHLIDYETVIRNAHDCLREGGAAVFFEPTIEGKAIVTLLMALVLRGDELSPDGRLTLDDRRRMRNEIRHLLKSKLGVSREELEHVEDKYIFNLEALRDVGRRAGFREVDVVNAETPVPTYWPYLVSTLRSSGVDAAKVERFRWIGNQLASTYSLLLEDQLVTPMAFFVFRK